MIFALALIYAIISGSSFSFPLSDTLLLILVGTSNKRFTNKATKLLLSRDFVKIDVISAEDSSLLYGFVVISSTVAEN